MKPHSYTSTGIILSKKNLGEADKIVNIYSKELGKISLIAKGIRKPRSKKRGHLEVFNEIKFQGISGKSMDLLIEVETVNNFALVRKSLNKISLAYYLCETVSKITHDDESSIEIYNLLKESLKSLQNMNGHKKLRLDFIHELLVLTGYHPVGEVMINHDKVLEDVIERGINSLRVGKRMLQ